MASKRNGQILVGLDIGTTKICAIVGELGSNGLDIIGIGTHPSKGLRKGVVVNIETTVSSIRRALDDAEAMAGVQIAEVFTGIAGGHIKSFASRGVVALKDREVREADIVRVIEQAKTLNIPLDREVIHVLPQEFIVDDQPGIREPLGMTGARLEAKVHIVTGAVASAQNIVRCANRAGLHVADIVLQPLASSESVLTEDEKELGVCLVDIGGGTTDIAVFENGSIVHSAVIALGGNNLTNDVAVGLRTPMEQAELIKQRHGAALTSLVRPEESIEVPSVGGRPPRTMRRQLLSEILEPRVEEIFQLVQHELERHNFAEVCTSGIVITGGTTLLPGMTELAEEVLGVPVRRGVPRGIGGLVDVVKSPIYATGVGLVMYGAKFNEQARFPVGGDNIWKNLRRRFGDWWNEIF